MRKICVDFLMRYLSLAKSLVLSNVIELHHNKNIEGMLGKPDAHQSE